jgi:proteasome accessory factor PafA2
MIKRILGTETEFGVAAKDPEALDPVSNSILLINSYPRIPSPQALWDYENENPLLDARGFEADGERERPGPEYNRLLNKVLANGGRLYVDGAHPEYSTPECTNARELVAYEKAGERIMDLCREMANRLKRGEDRFSVYKNNTDGKGNSYGYHENYLVSRQVPFDRLVTHLVPFLVTRQIYAGSGKVGSENKTEFVPYQISQRSDFFEVLVDLNTMVKRPIINTRDEPHADPSRYRRLHVIVGDANMSEISTYLKLGTASLVLEMIEEGLEIKIELENAVRAIKEVSRDTRLKHPLKLNNGKEWTAIEIQRFYLEAAEKHFSSSGADPGVKDILARWRSVLDRLAQEPMLLSRELDWVAKKELMESYMAKKGCGWDDPRISMMDLQYHDLRLDKGLYYALERGGYVERLVSQEELDRVLDSPPQDTRAYFRGMCVKKFPKEVYAASWTSVLFDVGNATIKKIPLLDPLRGSRDLVGPLLEGSETVEELLTNIAA